MTAKEAIEAIDDVLSSEYHYDETLGYQLTSDDFEWLEKAKQALEKQIPKKPNMSGYSCDKDGNSVYLTYDTYDCPNCHTSHEIECEKYDHCPDCGQVLDWSEDEND